MGIESRILRYIGSGEFQVCVSEAILAEYRDVLSRPKFHGFSKVTVTAVLANLARGVMVEPKTTISACSDPDDNRFLECAEAAEADYLITGNKRHFPAEWKGTKILNTREFLEALHL